MHTFLEPHSLPNLYRCSKASFGHGSAHLRVSFLLRVRSELWETHGLGPTGLVAPLRTPDLLILPCFVHIASARPQIDNFPPSQPDLAEEEKIKPFCPSIGLKLKRERERERERASWGLVGKNWPMALFSSASHPFQEPTSSLSGSDLCLKYPWCCTPCLGIGREGKFFPDSDLWLSRNPGGKLTREVPWESGASPGM